MADDTEPETTVLAGILETTLGRSPHGNTAQGERTSAVGFFGFVIASLFVDLNDGVELLKAAPRNACGFEERGDGFEPGGRVLLGRIRDRKRKAGCHWSPPFIAVSGG